MTTFHFQTHVSDGGVITLPPQAKKLYGKIVVVNVDQPSEDDEQPNPTDEQLEKMSTMCRGALEGMTREDFDQLREERRQRIAREHSRIADQTPEEWQDAVDDFRTSWKGCLKGVPHMTAKEIRAERLEKKYGQHGGQE